MLVVMSINRMMIYLLLVILVVFIPLASAEETRLILYDSATEVGVVGRKEYVNDKGWNYKTELFRSTEFKHEGPFDETKLVLYQTEHRYFDTEGKEIASVHFTTKGKLVYLRISEYALDKKISTKWFNESGHMYQRDEFKNGKWTTYKY